MTPFAGSLVVNTPGAKVSLDRKSLMVRTGGSATRVPIEGIDVVILVGRVNMSSEAIARCTSNGVRVAALTRGGKIRFVVSPPDSGNVHLRVAQVRGFDDSVHSLDVARVIVAAKLVGSCRLAQRWSWDAEPRSKWLIERSIDVLKDRHLSIGSARDANHLRGIEGDAARAYFKAMRCHLDGLETAAAMMRRTRRPPLDPANAALSFGYGLLTAELVGAAQAVGLDPQIGFFHQLRPGRPALALDVLEEFRAPIVDRFVVGALGRHQLRLEHFQETPGGGWYLNDAGRSEFFTLFEEFRSRSAHHELLDRAVPRAALSITQMAVLARFVRGELPCYVPWLGGP